MHHVCLYIRARRCESKTRDFVTVDTLTLCRHLRSKTRWGRRGHAVGSYQCAHFFLFILALYLSFFFFFPFKTTNSLFTFIEQQSQAGSFAWCTHSSIKHKSSMRCGALHSITPHFKTGDMVLACSIGSSIAAEKENLSRPCYQRSAISTRCNCPYTAKD